ncbi:uncharacterized protein LOC111647038 [Seriola lalandi dorsalis]|uniref:uncharacterized protein LOC111647038 n=1 Tax=Seriola lalandi dorsalis TaxID=1841481 RepID=UPI000C6FB1C3|nr:uncharacterized protein LOC111647038 [Seriola lalandi dorsalis]
MTSLKFASCLTGLFLWRIAFVTNLKMSSSVRQDSGFIPAKVGDNVTLRCFNEGKALVIYWYKQTLGKKPKRISSYYKLDKSGNLIDEFKNFSRFSIEIIHGKNHLTISDLHISDSATYYCLSYSANKFEFTEGVTVSVKGSGLNIQDLVHQSGSETIQPGGSVNLSCTVHTGTCDGEHSVYWFKDSEESHPGFIYTHGDRNDQCERKPETQTQTCVYNLPMKSLNLSHAGTYCAVASCGHVLFGKQKKFDSADKDNSYALVYLLSGALAFTTILAILLSYAAYRMNKSCPDSQARSSSDSASNTEGYQDSDNLHYAALKKHKINRTKRHRENTQTECVYSTVRQ